MRTALVCFLVTCGAAIASAAQETGEKIESIGSLITVNVNPGATQSAMQLRAKVGDLLQFRITSPALGRAVLSLQVSVDGDAKKVAVVSSSKMAENKPEPGSEGVSIFVLPERRGRANIKIVFVDNEGKPFRRVYNLEIVER